MTELKIGGTAVSLINDDEFSKIRAKYSIEDDFLASFDFAHMAGGGGKGGQLMGFTKCSKFIIKELNATDKTVLLDIFETYVSHLLSEEGSMLARIFLHFEFNGKQFMVMNNWMPPPNYAAVEGQKLGFDIGANYAQYDLKGCADDKTLKSFGTKVEPIHKRIFKLHLWLGSLFWSPERSKYKAGKNHAARVGFPVTKPTYDSIMGRITRDAEFLKLHNLMDYSLVVSFHAVPAVLPAATRDLVYAGTSDGGDQPFIGTKGNASFVVYVGIIDFLQDWNTSKVIAEKVKILECNKATVPPVTYADRFVQCFADKFVPNCV